MQGVLWTPRKVAALDATLKMDKVFDKCAGVAALPLFRGIYPPSVVNTDVERKPNATRIFPCPQIAVWCEIKYTKTSSEPDPKQGYPCSEWNEICAAAVQGLEHK